MYSVVPLKHSTVTLREHFKMSPFISNKQVLFGKSYLKCFFFECSGVGVKCFGQLVCVLWVLI